MKNIILTLLTFAGAVVGEILLLLTDVVMPEMSGRDPARNLRNDNPNLKRLFMSAARRT